MSYQLLHGDCLDKLKEMDDNSVDAIVTDPPYGLSFMGKKWDYDVPSVEVWSECLRVLKHGGHLLAFAGSRTYHRLVVNVEDAGFEIRDQIMWVYGSGFPKSLNISKAIDKRGGESVAWFGQWLREWRTKHGIKQKEISVLFPSRTGNLTGCVANWELGLSLPTNEQFNKICKHFNLPFKDMEEAEREVIGKQIRPSGRQFADGMSGFKGGEIEITASTTPEAKQWDGWGSALKPAHEPIVVARKPLIGTIVENVLEHGTGGLNIDGCRIGAGEEMIQGGGNGKANHGGRFGAETNGERPFVQPHNKGRFPANFIHDGSDEVVSLFPETGKSAGGRIGNAKGAYSGLGDTGFTMEHTKGDPGYGDSGSAARFFYCAKASKGERNAGLDHHPSKKSQHNSGGIGREISVEKRLQEGEENAAMMKNIHPTVKPVDLMKYLCRLITPPNGIVLDPFMGSGTTGIAATTQGFGFIGIERDEEYIPIARDRIKHWTDEYEEVVIEQRKQKTLDKWGVTT